MSKLLLSARKLPQQARSAATMAVILDAATRVLSKHSLAGFNTNRVAEVAGVSVGSLYQYFPNKSVLIAALIEREQMRLVEAVAQCVMGSDGKPLKEILSELIDIAIEHQFGRSVFAAALDHEERRLPVDETIRAAQQEMVISIQKMLQSVPELRKQRISPHAALDCLTITKALVESEASSQQVNTIRLKQSVLQALQGYLLYRA